MVFDSNTQAVTVGASDVLGRCLYWGNLLRILGIVCAQLQLLAVFVWGSYRVDCQDRGMAGAGAADRRNEQKNDGHVREIGREKRTKTQRKISEMVVQSSAVVPSVSHISCLFLMIF